MRARRFPVAITGDMEKAFLQIRVKECKRDALRFHRRTNQLADVEVLQFTRVLFGLASSPFAWRSFGSALRLLEEQSSKSSGHANEKSVHVDDIISEGNTVGEAKQRKSEVLIHWVMQPFHFINGRPPRTNWTEKVTATKIARNKQQQNNSSV